VGINEGGDYEFEGGNTTHSDDVWTTEKIEHMMK